MKYGSLVIVGTGIQALAHITFEVRPVLEKADIVLFSVADPITARWIKQIKPDAEALSFVADGTLRRDKFDQIINKILGFLRAGQQVCALFYGHPGVVFYPAHEAIKRAREEGCHARMLPGISSADCLFADLGVDPAQHGCQSFEATDFLVYNRNLDTRSAVILWRIGAIGESTVQPTKACNHQGLETLIEVLRRDYAADQETIVYESALFSISEPSIQRVTLAGISTAQVTGLSTLYIPPKEPASLDHLMLQKLGITPEILMEGQYAN